MKTTKTILIVGLLLAIAFTSPDKQHDHMKMMKQKQDKMTQPAEEGMMQVNLPSIQCGMCKNTIETGMNKVPGIKSVTVDVDTKTAKIMYDPALIATPEIEQSISKLGYWANSTPADPSVYTDLPGCCQMSDSEYGQMMKKSKMEHDAMKESMPVDHQPSHTTMAMISLPTIQCGMCESRIERELPKVAGIVSVDVVVEKNMGHIMYDSDLITLNGIETAIANIGYQANETPADAKAYKKLPGCCKVN